MINQFGNSAEDDSDESFCSQGGYCSSGCRHWYEEICDSGGRASADADNDGYFGYYYDLGYSVDEGRFCEDYE